MREWTKEPDHLEFETNGYRALVLRNPSLGHLNGYLAIPKSHLLYGVDSVPSEIPSHKGWTYCSELHPHTGKDDGTWWIGFDCAHAGDLLPNVEDIYEQLNLHVSDSPRKREYRDVAFVRGVLEEASLAVKHYMGPNVVLFGGQAS